MIWQSPHTRTLLNNLQWEVWRDDPEIKPEWEAMCPTCGAEYKEYREWCESANCQLEGRRCLRPDPAEKKKFTQWAEKVNINNQDFWDLSKQISFQVHAFDNPVAVWSFQYEFNELGDLISKVPVELIAIKPEQFRLVQDIYGRPGGKEKVCPIHREEVYGYTDERQACGKCGLPLHNVTAVSVMANQPNIGSQRESIDKRYIDGEWFHVPYYTETMNYGISLVYTAWVIITTMYYMQELKNNTYKHGKPPKSIIMFNSANGRSIKSQLAEEFKHALKNRNYIPKISFSSENRTPAQVLNVLPPDSEMQTLEHEKHMGEVLAILFSQTSDVQADASSGGGLNNDGLKLTMFLRKIEHFQKWFEKEWFKWVFDGLGIKGYKMEFPPPKEMDRMAVIQRKAENLKPIATIMDRGGEIEIVDDKDLTYRMTGKIGAMQTGVGGHGYEEVKGSGWTTQDFQHKDASLPSVSRNPILPWKVLSGNFTTISGTVGPLKKRSSYLPRMSSSRSDLITVV